MRGSALAGSRWTRVIPHVVDTLFLATGILLAISIGQYPWTVPWLAAKLGGLVLYIVLGMIAMSARASGFRIAAFACALLTYGWIVSVARLKTPLGLFHTIL